MAARSAQRIGLATVAAKLNTEADRLAERFEAAFWCPEIGTYALALDGAKQHVEAERSSVEGDLALQLVLLVGAAAIARAAVCGGARLWLGGVGRGSRASRPRARGLEAGLGQGTPAEV